MADDLTFEDALAALAWQVELGADEAVLDQPVDRFDLPTQKPAAPAAAPVTAAAPDHYHQDVLSSDRKLR